MSALVEFRDEAPEAKIGDSITVEQFEPGVRVKVSATAVGKGFQGTIKRHNFGRGAGLARLAQRSCPGVDRCQRRSGARVQGTKMPGRMGGGRVTERGLEVFQVDADRNLLLLRGAVPGPKGGTVEVRTDG